jgi:hypothetical protein
MPLESSDKSKDAAQKPDSTLSERIQSENKDAVEVIKSLRRRNDSPLPALTVPSESAKSTVKVDNGALEKDVIALRKATGLDNSILGSSSADREKIIDILKSRSASERAQLDKLYRTQFHRGIEDEMKSIMSGSDFSRLQAALHRNDEDKASQSADRINVALVERSQLIAGRSNAIIEKDLRDTLRSSTKAEIDQIALHFQKEHGVSLEQAIKDSNVSDLTKQALNIYLAGCDRLKPEQKQKLAELATSSGTLEMFSEAMRTMSSAERSKYLESGGQKAIEANFSGSKLQHCLDFAKQGELSTATQIKENTGWFFNNAKGIELALNQMSDQERSDYRIGKFLSRQAEQNTALSEDDKTRLDALTESQKAHAGDTFNSISQLIDKAGNATEAAKWRTMAENGDGFVSGLDKHRGFFSNDASNDIAKSIENMSQADWQKARANPNAATELDAMLRSLNKSDREIADLKDLFKQKLTADTYEHSKEIARRPILNALDGAEHWYRNDGRDALEALSHMSTAEQKAYREDPSFKNELDDKLKEVLGNSGSMVAARHILQAVSDGTKPQPQTDLVTMMAQYAADFSTDKAQAIRDLRDRLKEDPALRERLRNPKTDEDLAFARSFDEAAKSALGQDKYKTYVQELINKGDISAEKMAALSRGLTTDSDKMLQDFAKLGAEERNHILKESAYRQRVFSGLNDNERQIAANVLTQGEYKAEDKIRNLVDGFGGSKEIVAALKEVPPEKINEMRNEYARKYSRSLDSDLADKLSGQQLAEGRRALAANQSQNVQVEMARDDAYKTRSGFGAGFADLTSATGSQADNNLDKLIAASTNAAKNGETASAEQMKKLVENLATAVDNHRETKGAVAEYAADAVIAGGAIASVIATGGTDLPLVAAVLAAGGAATKVGTKAAFMGQDYDMRLDTAAADVATGAITGATAVFGQAELAVVFQIGKQAATKAATATLETLGAESLAQIAGRTGISAAEHSGSWLAVGYEQTLAKGTEATMRQLLATGAKSIDAQAFKGLAEQLVDKSITGELRDAAVLSVQNQIVTNMTREFTKETANYLVYQATSQGLNAGAGAVGSTASGALESAQKWDSHKSLSANLSDFSLGTFSSALSGAGGALFLGGIFKATEHGITAAAKSTERFKANLDPTSEVNARLPLESRLDLKRDPSRQIRRIPDELPPDPINMNPPQNDRLRLSEGPQLLAAKEAPGEARGRIPTELAPEKLAADYHERPGRAGRDFEPLWHPQRKLESMSVEERTKLIGDLRGLSTPLDNRAKVNEFFSAIENVTAGFDRDLAPNIRVLSLARRNYDEAWSQTSSLFGEYPDLVRNQEWTPGLLRQAAAGNPEHVRLLTNYMEKRDIYGQQLEATRALFDKRAASVQKAVDQFTEANGLPHLQVAVNFSDVMVGSKATYGAAVMSLNPEALTSNYRTLYLAESTYHELTHHEQHFVVARNIADEMGLPAKPHPDQTLAYRDYLAQRLGRHVSTEEATEILTKRATAPQLSLTEAEKIRAQAMEASLLNNSSVRKMVDLGNDYRVVASELKALISGENPNAAYLLIQKLSRGDQANALRRRLFGDQPPIEEIAYYNKLITRHNRGEDTWTKEEAQNARAFLAEHLKSRIGEINETRQQVYGRYMQLHEQDALVAGQRARLEGLARGHRDAPDLFEQFTRDSSTRDFSATESLDNSVMAALDGGGRQLEKVEPPKVRVDVPFGKRPAEISGYDVNTDILRFDSVEMITRTHPKDDALRRPGLKIGDTITPKSTFFPGVPAGTALKIANITRNEHGHVSYFLEYKGPVALTRNELNRLAPVRTAELDEYVGNSVRNAIIDGTFKPSLKSGGDLTPVLVKLAREKEILSLYDGLSLNRVLRGARAEEIDNVYKEVVNRAQNDRLEPENVRIWLDSINDRFTGNSVERRARSIEFLRYCPEDKLLSANPEQLTTAVREALTSAQFKNLPTEENAKIIVKLVHAMQTRKGHYLPATESNLQVLMQGIDPAIIDKIGDRDFTMLMGRVGELAKIRDSQSSGDGLHWQAYALSSALKESTLKRTTLEEALAHASAEDLALLRQAVAGSHDYLSMQNLNQTFDQLADELRLRDSKETGRAFVDISRPKEARYRSVEIANVVVNDDSAGRALAYAFRKRTGISVRIHTFAEGLPEAAVALELPRNAAQLEALRLAQQEGKAHIAEKLVDFDKKLNFFDIAQAEVDPAHLKTKFDALIAAERLSAKTPPPLRTMESEHEAIFTAITGGTAGTERVEAKALVSFLKIDSQFAEAAAQSYANNARIVTLRDMVASARKLQDKLELDHKPEDIIYITNAEREGSSIFVTELARRSLEGRAQFRTIEQAKAELQGDKARGKVLVVLDDGILSGGTAKKHAELLDNLLQGIGPGGTGKVAVLEGYESGMAEFEAARQALAARKKGADVSLEVVNPPQTNLQELVLNELVALEGARRLDHGAIDKMLGLITKSQVDKSQVVTGIVFPHMVPNNNPDHFNNVMRSIMDLAGAHSESSVRNKKVPLDYGPPNSGIVEPGVYRGGAGTRAQLTEIFDANEGGLIIDLRTPKETVPKGDDKVLTPEQERKFIEQLQKEGKYPHLEYRSIPMSTAKDKLPGDEVALEIAAAIKEARAKGIKVFIHCQRGSDRTGYGVASFQVLERNKGPKKAWAEAVAYGFNRDLSGLGELIFGLSSRTD